MCAPPPSPRAAPNRARAACRWIALVDDDTFVFPRNLAAHLATLDHHKKVDAPVVHVRLRLAGGFEFGPMPVALTQLERARPLLVGMDVLGELFAAGLHIAR